MKMVLFFPDNRSSLFEVASEEEAVMKLKHYSRAFRMVYEGSSEFIKDFHKKVFKKKVSNGKHTYEEVL